MKTVSLDFAAVEVLYKQLSDVSGDSGTHICGLVHTGMELRNAQMAVDADDHSQVSVTGYFLSETPDDGNFMILVHDKIIVKDKRTQTFDFFMPMKWMRDIPVPIDHIIRDIESSHDPDYVLIRCHFCN